MKKRAHGQLDSEMPLRRYFLFAGGALLTLLLAANWLLPLPASNELTNSRVKLPAIRIHSELRGPQAVVIDMSKSNVGPMLAHEDAVVPQGVTPSEATVDEVFAQPDAPSRPQTAANERKTNEGQRQSTRKLRAASLERRPTSIHGSRMHVEPNIASLRSGSEFGETFAQFVPRSLKQPRRGEAIAGRRTMVLGWKQ
jgi:hypothetical protein